MLKRLLFPSDSLVDCVLKLEHSFRSNYEIYSRQNNVFQSLVDALKNQSIDAPIEIINEFVKIRIKIRLNHVNNTARNLREEKWNVSNAKKSKLFAESSK